MRYLLSTKHQHEGSSVSGCIVSKSKSRTTSGRASIPEVNGPMTWVILPRKTDVKNTGHRWSIGYYGDYCLSEVEPTLLSLVHHAERKAKCPQAYFPTPQMLGCQISNWKSCSRFSEAGIDRGLRPSGSDRDFLFFFLFFSSFLSSPFQILVFAFNRLCVEDQLNHTERALTGVINELAELFTSLKVKSKK